MSYLPSQETLVNPTIGTPTLPWLRWFMGIEGDITALQQDVAGQLSRVLQDSHADRVANYDPADYVAGDLFYETDRTVLYRLNAAETAWVYATGEMSAAFADVPTDLGTDDEGFLLQITDYGHRVRWDGAAWEFAPGDQGNGYFQDFAVAPTVPGWALCNGIATTYLTMGAAIAETAFTPPDLSGTAAYRKSAAAYTGAITAATAPGISGSTGSTAPGISGNVASNTVSISGDTANATATISGETADESAHTHTFSDTSSGPSGSSVGVTIGTDDQAANATHDHDVSGTTSAGSAHKHGVGTLAVDNHLHGTGTLAGDAHDHGVGTLAVASHLHAVGTLAVDATGEPARMGVLVWFRR
jgi:hypothetical protein